MNLSAKYESESAIDGSEIAVAHNKNNETEFGLKGGNQHSYPSARLTALYDVTNDRILDTVFTGISVGEREHAPGFFHQRRSQMAKDTKT